MNVKYEWDKIKEIIDNGESFLITTHINPDGDAIGSEYAMYYYLKSQKKEVSIINADKLPELYHFLDKENQAVQKYKPEYNRLIREVDVIIVLDISTVERLGKMGKEILESKAKKICLDHHTTNDIKYDVAVIDQEASATGELIYFYFKDIGYEINIKIAECLYVTILTDTGSFRFSNSTSRAHYVTSELLKFGIDHRKIYEFVYENNPARKIFLFSKSLNTLEIVHNGRIGSLELTQAMLKSTGTTKEDAEGFVDYINTIKGVKLALLFYEVNKNTTKVSLRSKGEIDVDKFASEFGGGGHAHASGIYYTNGKLKEVKKKVVNRAKQYI